MSSENASSFIRAGKPESTSLTSADANGPHIFREKPKNTLPATFERESSLVEQPVRHTIHGRHGI
jgi:hypothetical protein